MMRAQKRKNAAILAGEYDEELGVSELRSQQYDLLRQLKIQEAAQV